MPTQGVLLMLERRGFRNLRQWTHGVDTQAFPFHGETARNPMVGALAHPVSLYVGRISYEKNIASFLQTEMPGTKIVCGVGPLEATRRAGIYASLNFNYTSYLAAAILFIAITIPLTRLTDWLLRRSARLRELGMTA